LSTHALFRQLRRPIGDLLLRSWDPIGVQDVPEAQDEYDNYVPRVFSLLANRATPKQVADYLFAVETDRMGMTGDDSKRDAVSRQLVALAVEHGISPGPYPCPACGFLVFVEPPGSYDICPVCGWEDDAVQLRHPALCGGANASSLVEAQRRAVLRYPIDVQVTGECRRDLAWRPLSDPEWQRALATLSPGGHLPALGGPYNEELYYWLGGLGTAG